MKAMMRWRQPTFNIFLKMLTAFVIVLAPLYLLSLQIYSWGESSIKREIYHSIQSQVRFYLTSLDKEIERVTNFQREYVNNEDLMKLAIAESSLNDYERSVMIHRIWYQLNMIQRSSQFIQKASAYIPGISRRISNEDFTEAIPEKEFEALHRHAFRPESPVLEWNHKLFISESYPNPPLPMKATPMFVLSLELSTQQLQDYLRPIVDSNKGIAELRGQGWVIRHEPQGGQLIMQETAEPIQTKAGDAAAGSVIWNGKRYLSVTDRSSALSITLSVLVPEEEVLGQLTLFRTYFWGLTIIAFAIVTVFSYWIYRLVHQPLTQLVRAFGKVVTGNLTIHLHHNGSDEFKYLYDQFNLMVSRLKTLIQEVYEQKIRVQRSELKQLQSQINPHFLYNSFYILHRMSKLEDNEKLQAYTKYLGDYFQFVTRNDSDEVAFGEEMKHCRSYIEIQNFRFGSRIRVEVDPVPEQVKDVMVPRLILQPLVENAYKYALEDKPHSGLLAVRIQAYAHQLIVEVEDNGPGMEPERLTQLNVMLKSDDNLEEVTALVNISRRLKLKFGPAAGGQVQSLGQGGLTVRLTIPLEKMTGE